MLTENEMLQSMRFRSEVSLQITLDQDYNIPDNKADMEKMVVENGEVQIQNVKVMQDKMIVKGSLFWRIAYLKDRQSCTLDHMEGELPFEELVNMDGVTEDARIRTDWEMEDLRVTMIHSRKISVRSVLNLKVRAFAIEEIPAVSGFSESDANRCQRMEVLPVSQISVHKKDTIRIREEVNLPGNKANMVEMIWGEVQNRKMDIRPQDEKLLLRGELSVFFLYSGENEENPFEYAEAELPWYAELPCSGMREDMIVSSHLHKISQSLEMKADMDGEMRSVIAEMVLEIDMTAYEEKHVNLAADVYSLKTKLTPVYREAAVEHVLIRNQAECKLYDRLRMPGEHSGILQLCHPWAEIRMDRLEVTEGGIRAEGVADVHILYVNEDDRLPLNIAAAMLPFSCVTETGILPAGVNFEVQPYLDQISAVMLDGDTAEIKMTIRLDTLVWETREKKVMTDIEESETDDDYVESLPNMTGYVVRKGDTLFLLGKRFCTTAEEIQRINHLEKEDVSEGDRLLIMKHMAF